MAIVLTYLKKPLWRLITLCVLSVVLTVLFSPYSSVDGFIFWKAKTTACDICDGIDTYSGRNVMCCFLSSKCCGYATLDEAEAIRANMSATTASP